MDERMELGEEKAGPVELLITIPDTLKTSLISNGLPVAVQGERFQVLMQQFKGEGFEAWYSKYVIQAPTVLKARADMPMLELRIAWRRKVQVEWDKVIHATLPQHTFQLSFVPHVLVRSVFGQPYEYETFDVHFELSFLETIGIDYRMLANFIEKIYKNHPAELAPKVYSCSLRMIAAIQDILTNEHSEAGKVRLLKASIDIILIEALEVISKAEIIKHPLTPADKEALQRIHTLIAEKSPEYLGNAQLLFHVFPHLNTLKLHYGFKQLFGINPYDYYQQVRFELGKKLLLQGRRVEDVALTLEYESATSFIKVFKQRYGCTPKFFQKNNKATGE